jgi:hypothetical protein
MKRSPPERIGQSLGTPCPLHRESRIDLEGAAVARDDLNLGITRGKALSKKVRKASVSSTNFQHMERACSDGSLPNVGRKGVYVVDRENLVSRTPQSTEAGAQERTVFRQRPRTRRTLDGLRQLRL